MEFEVIWDDSLALQCGVDSVKRLEKVSHGEKMTECQWDCISLKNMNSRSLDKSEGSVNKDEMNRFFVSAHLD